MIGWVLLCLIAVATGWISYRYAWWRKAVDYRYPRVLMYHMVRDPIPGKKFNSLRVAPENFERQIRYLSENGWESFTMAEAVARREALPEKSVVITFDDGYRDNLTNALPILQRYGFKATVYLVNDRHDRDWSGYRKAKNEGAGLKEEPKLSDEEVERMIRSGLIEIGAHTLTHANLSALDAEESRHEICGSKAQIEERFGVACRSFAYPFGLYGFSDPVSARECGYASAVTTRNGIADLNRCDLFEIPRVTVSGKDSLWAFALKLRSGKRGVKR